MDELIDIVTIDGKPTGKTALKSIVHTKGYYHNTAHIWFYTKQGSILLAQRAASKVVYPLLWDVSVAGHIDAGEALLSGAIREIQEEIGLTISETNLHKIGVFECFQNYKTGIVDNEFHHTFITELNVPIEKLILQKEEVEAVKTVSIEAFRTLLKHSKTNNHFVASNQEYYEVVLENIEKRVY